jgi:hypothetical protein
MHHYPHFHGLHSRVRTAKVQTTGQFSLHKAMPKYVIERDLPGAGSFSGEQLRAVAQKSCAVLENLGPQIQWVQSYVTDDKIYCVYIAPNASLVREHASQGGFPANRVSEVKAIIDPATAEWV